MTFFEDVKEARRTGVIRTKPGRADIMSLRGAFGHYEVGPGAHAEVQGITSTGILHRQYARSAFLVVTLPDGNVKTKNLGNQTLIKNALTFAVKYNAACAASTT